MIGRRAGGAVAQPAGSGPPARVVGPPVASAAGTFVLVAVAAACAALGAAAAGQLRVKLLGGVVAGVVVLIAVRLFKNRQLVLFVAGVPLALGFILHKSFGTIVPLHDGGAPSISVTTLDAVVVVLWAMWWYEGSLGRDLRELADRPVFWVPWIGGLLSLVSVLNASSLRLVFAEVLRWFFMYLLFVYVALRVRSRHELRLFLAGLGGLGIMEIGIIFLQWKTGGVLGLHFLGVPTALDVRTTNSGTVGRPFGSFTHPVFMAAIMGVLSLAAITLCIFIESPRLRIGPLHGRRIRVALAALGFVFALPIVISQARSAALGWAVAFPVLIAIGVRYKKINRKGLAWLGVGLVAALIAGSPILYHYYRKDVASAHFPLEIQARWQLNSLAAHIWATHLWAGIGLNNFQQVMDQYNTKNLIFNGNPVHNLLLLQGSETGILGVIGMVFIGLTFFGLAIKLSRVGDPLLRSIGVMAVVAYVFWYAEEQLEFSLREDAPLALFWILAGLVVASLRIANGEAELAGAAERPASARELVPASSPAGGGG
ncbi:MAG TPA: O-antigen ligase family protein [Acidimicrobiales bacterium]|nr:O-antigen ligase family protein [Acidimicrobiales bacterium]